MRHLALVLLFAFATQVHADEPTEPYSHLPTLAETISFNTGSAQVRRKEMEKIDHVAELLASNPQAIVGLVGNTITAGDLEVNEKLAQYRADAVARLLVERGVAKGRITTIPIPETGEGEEAMVVKIFINEHGG